MGESVSTPVRLQFDRRLRLEFHGGDIDRSDASTIHMARPNSSN